MSGICSAHQGRDPSCPRCNLIPVTSGDKIIGFEAPMIDSDLVQLSQTVHRLTNIVSAKRQLISRLKTALSTTWSSNERMVTNSMISGFELEILELEGIITSLRELRERNT